MRPTIFLNFLVGILVSLSAICTINAEDPYLYYTWTVTYGLVSPLGIPQKGILINGQFPGPTIEAVTNDNIIVNVINKLDEPFLITWNGIKQRKTTWQDGVLGTNCPIPPNTNWTYRFQAKDQIGTFNYFPSTKLHRAVGGFGGFNIAQRSVIAVPYPIPAGEFTLLVSDWYKTSHEVLQQTLDSGKTLPLPYGLLINGLHKSAIFTGEKGKTYKFRVSNVGIATSINFRIQGHTMTLVEVEGAHTLQEVYESLDVHPGQSVAVLVTLHGSLKDYFIIASSRFTKPILATTGYLSYAANAARPNPQGSFHYGTIPIVRRLVLANTAAKIETPLKLADWLNIPGVFNLDTIKDTPTPGPAVFGASVVGTTLHDFVEIVFQNTEPMLQSWHLDGYSFYVVGYGSGNWTPDMRRRYNLVDAVSRHTVQVYPTGWSAVLVSLDNKGMWNLRSAIWSRRYLGQQLYVRVWNNEHSLFTETDMPLNALLCGKAKH
ncbi:L-ascorbate oxidase homolog [Prunus yedoensis var. nudiflora]|uniref:L-ascorbate oxidase homolog n=1 Tax=Prunus yedoensis var. nudiflora TaxID=2094558 RepID=A0A314Y769_PRUYE|nr:L-ascorbate oxidase homolog [Prunus yedoensis var. nudiflora]